MSSERGSWTRALPVSAEGTTGLRPVCKRALVLFAMFVALVVPGSAAADEQTVVRSGIALKVFPRVVAVDMDVAGKVGSDGALHLVLVYDVDPAAARRLRDRLARDVDRILDWPVLVELRRPNDLTSEAGTPAALLVVEPLSEPAFQAVRAFGTTNHRMVFSPFIGDVERGATVGLDVGVRVAPYFNQSVLAESTIEINPQILRVSKIHR